MDWEQISTACSGWCFDKSYASLLFPDRNTVQIPQLNHCLCKHTTGFSEELPYVALKTVSSCLFFVVVVILLPKVYFPNYHWKQKEFRWDQSKLIYSFSLIKYLLAHSNWSPDAERWFMKGIAFNTLPFSSVWHASKKWNMSIFLGRSGPKQRLSQNFLNYSAPIITVWILLLKIYASHHSFTVL